MQEQTRRSRVAVIGTGGTIQSMGSDSLDLHNYGTSGNPKLEPEQLIERIPEVNEIADIVLASYREIGSASITSTIWLELHALIHRLVEENSPLDGVVITHGTSSLEETAYFLNLTLNVDIPVVLIGSQRPFSAVSSDAGLNLINGIRTACSPAARGLGVLVVLNDEIQAARDVTKGSTYRLEAFRTPDIGMLGYADPDEIVIYRRPTRRHAPDTEFDVTGLSSLPRVDVIYSHVDADRVAIDAVVEAGAKGIVFAGFAPGSLTPGQVNALADARDRGVVLVQSSRVGSGRVLDSDRRREYGAISADNLNPQKARILLALALTITNDADTLRRIFSEY